MILGAAFAVILIFGPRPDPTLLPYFLTLTLPRSILAVTSAIIFLIGFAAIYRHRGEPGLVRDRNMRRSLFLMVGTIVATLSSLFLTFFWPFLPPNLWSSGALGVLAMIALLQSGVAIVVAVFLAFLLYYTVVSFVPARLLSRLNLAVILLVLNAIVTFALTLASMVSDFPFGKLDELFIALIALSVVLFWSVYRASGRSLSRSSNQSTEM